MPECVRPGDWALSSETLRALSFSCSMWLQLHLCLRAASFQRPAPALKTIWPSALKKKNVKRKCALMDNTQVLRPLYNCLRNPSGQVTSSAAEVWASGYKRSLKAVKVTKSNDHYVSVGATSARHNHGLLQVHVQKATPVWCWMCQVDVFLTWEQSS